MVDLVDVNTNDPDSIKYIINTLRGNAMLATKQFLKSKNVPDIGSIPISSEEYINESINLTQEKWRTSCFQKYYHIYNIHSNPGMTSYITSIPIPCLG